MHKSNKLTAAIKVYKNAKTGITNLIIFGPSYTTKKLI